MNRLRSALAVIEGRQNVHRMRVEHCGLAGMGLRVACSCGWDGPDRTVDRGWRRLTLDEQVDVFFNDFLAHERESKAAA